MSTPLIVARAVHFGSCLVLQAVFAILFLVLLPAWRQAGGASSPLRQNVDKLLHRLLALCLGLAFVSGFLWLWLSIAGMSGLGPAESLRPDLFWMVLTQTQPGHVWMLRAGLALALAVALLFAKETPLLCGLLATLLVASLAWLGHAGAAEGPGQTLQLAGDLLHLIAAGIWPGGLVPLAIFLSCLLKSREPASFQAACVATRRFSTLSVVAVAALAISGLANTWFLVGTFHALATTDYGRLLLLKLTLFGVMFGIGAWNLLRFTPPLEITGMSLPGDAQVAALAKIKRNVVVEIVLGAFILLIVGLLGITAPALHS